MNTRVCCKCHKEYPLTSDYFYRNYTSKNEDKLSYTCKTCQKEINKLSYQKSKQTGFKSQKEHYKDLPKTKTCTCQKCGKQFEVQKSDKGYFYLKRKFCDECSKPEDVKIVSCLSCGKDIILKRSKRTGNFSQQRYCDDCLSPKATKTLICQKCGKKFSVGRCAESNRFLSRKYCDDCTTDGKTTKICTCQICGKQFNVNRSTTDGNFLIRKLCDPCFYTSITSIPEKNFENLLNSKNIKYIREFKVEQLYYDFYLPDYNVLVELNPTFSHTCEFNGFYKPKSKNYHYNKSTTAKESGYICICVWDWDNWDDIIKLIKQPNLKMIYTGINLHYSRGKEQTSDENSIIEGYRPIYDDGYKVIF